MPWFEEVSQSPRIITKQSPPPQAMFDTLIYLIIWITIMCIMCLNKTISSAPRFPRVMLLLRCLCHRLNCLTNPNEYVLCNFTFLTFLDKPVPEENWVLLFMVWDFQGTGFWISILKDLVCVWGGGGVLWDSNMKISPSVSRGESGKFCI